MPTDRAPFWDTRGVHRGQVGHLRRAPWLGKGAIMHGEGGGSGSPAPVRGTAGGVRTMLYYFFVLAVAATSGRPTASAPSPGVDSKGASVLRGCMVPHAVNYDPRARVHDRSCVYAVPGCTDSTKVGFNPRATADDGSCRAHKVLGCTHPAATNFNQHANVDDGSCHHVRRGCTRHDAPNYDALAKVDDGSCAPAARRGCMSSRALNFDAQATVDSGRCKFAVKGCMDPNAINFNSAATHPSGDCVARVSGCMARSSITFNANATTHDQTSCQFRAIKHPPTRRGCVLSEALNYDAAATVDDGSCVLRPSAPSVLTLLAIPSSSAKPDMAESFPTLSPASAALCKDVVMNAPSDSSTSVHDCQKSIAHAALESQRSTVRQGVRGRSLTHFQVAHNDDDQSSEQVNSCSKAITLIETMLASVYNATNRTIPCGCMDTRALNYDAQAIVSDGLCRIVGCTDSSARTYDPAATISGQCQYHRIGCMAPGAENFDPLATKDNVPSTCVFLRSGCTDPSASNYQAYAQKDDGSCTPAVLGCMDPLALDFNQGATSNGECMYDIRGCTESSALNYVPHATTSDNSCIQRVSGCTIEGTPDYVATNYNPNANAYAPCEFARVGCMDSNAFNYDRHATVANSLSHPCVPRVTGCIDPQAQNFNQQANTLDIDACTYPPSGCKDPSAANYDPAATADDGYCAKLGCISSAALNYDTSATVDDGSCAFPLRGCTDSRAQNYMPLAGIEDGSCVIPGCMDSRHPDFNSLFTAHTGCRPIPSGCIDPTALNFVSGAVRDDGSCSFPGCTDRAAENFDPKATFNDGTCRHAIAGCMDSRAANYVSVAHVADPDKPCLFGGCTNSFDAAYSSLASFDDGSCSAPRFGCTSSLAANYDSMARFDSGDCIILGCTFSLSPAFNPKATRDDGSCPPTSGCTNPIAANYASYALIDDGTCEILGCTDSRRPGYNPTANVDDNSCGRVVTGCQDSRSISYVAVANAGGSELCDWLGCTDSTAHNYNPSATILDYTCRKPTQGCSITSAINYVPEATVDDGSCYILGCTNSMAKNYNAAATADDGTCQLLLLGCTDSTADNFDDEAEASSPDIVCLYVGCKDSNAENYDPTAQYDSGLCTGLPSPPALMPPPPPVAPPPRPFSDGTVSLRFTLGGDSMRLSSLISKYDHFGSAVSSLDDIDGDLVTDIAVGAYNTAYRGTRREIGVGAVYIITLLTTGVAKSVAKITKGTHGFTGELGRFDNFGSAITSLGDLNGDGCNELAVGAPGDDTGGSSVGAVHVLFLKPSPGSTPGCAAGDSLQVTSSKKMAGETFLEEFGAAVAAPGDINGDGVPDLIVGAPGRESLGAIYLISLNSDGSKAGSTLLAPSTWGATGPELALNGRFGASLAAAPVPYDASPEASRTVAVGAPASGSVYLVELAGSVRRRRSLQTSTSNGLSDIAGFRTLTSPEDGVAFGEALAYAADYDGNGARELVVGAPNQGAGAVHIHFMNSAGNSAYKVVVLNAVREGKSRFGRAVASVGALNMDDIVSDLIVGARDDSPDTAMGSVTILFMNPSAPFQQLHVPPSPPPLLPISSSITTSSLSADIFNRDGALIGVWSVAVIIVFLMTAWFTYFGCIRKHKVKELHKTPYLVGPFRSAAARIKSGRITRSCRLEFRGPSSSTRASTVRATIPEGLAAKPLPRKGVSSAPMLDPDVLLNVSYAPNVPRGGPSSQTLPPSQPMSPRAASGATHVVDLSDVALLRGEGPHAACKAEYTPNYARNAPSASGGFDPTYAANVPSSCVGGADSQPARNTCTLGGLSAVSEEDRVGTWGGPSDAQDSQATWQSDPGQTLNPACAGVVPREPGTVAMLPAAHEPNSALLRI